MTRHRTCPHWHGYLDPCPACACGERVGAGLPTWSYGSTSDLAKWESDCLLDAWEADWRERLKAWRDVKVWQFWRWATLEEACRLRDIAAKLRRMNIGEEES